MSEPLAQPAQFAGLLRKTAGKVHTLSSDVEAGRLQASPDVLGLVLRYTAGIVSALERGVQFSS